MTRPESPTKRAVAEFIAKYTDEHGYSPSFREISEAVGANLSSVHYHVKVLVKEGSATMLENQPRTLRMVSQPRVRV